MARPATLPKGQWDLFDRNLNATDLTAEEIEKLNKYPKVLEVMLAAMRAHPDFNLVHDRFTRLADKLAQVRSWPGINSEDVTAALVRAASDGTIAGHDRESASNPLLDIVVTVNRESVPATLLYARDRMKEAHGDRYSEWGTAYAEGVDDRRVKLIEGAKPFVPNRIVVEVVDLDANWNRKDGVIDRDDQQAQVAQLAGFAVLYAASQSPEWVRQMDGKKVPYALAAALLLNVPGSDEWASMPCVNFYRDSRRVGLDARCCVHGDSYVAAPVLRDYRR